MKKAFVLSALLISFSTYSQELLLTKITGRPVLDAPKLLEWPDEHEKSTLNLTDPTSNVLHEFHGSMNDCELSFSALGDFYPALADFWPKYLEQFPKSDPLKNWFYFAGVPVTEEQITSGYIQVGSYKIHCRPQVALVNFGEIQKLQVKGHIEGEPVLFSRIREYAVLVRKGNPKKIKTVYDLARPDVSFVTPSPTKNPGSFVTTVRILYRMAQMEPGKMTPDQLIDKIFNTKNNGKKIKWLTADAFIHRGAPWSLSYGRGDASFLTLQMADNIKKTFPELFDVVTLKNSEIEKLFPDSHNGEVYLARIKGNWSKRQKEAQDKLISTLLSDEFTQTLKKYGIERSKK